MQTTKETLTIQTPEQVGFQYALAGLGSRTTAFLLDTLLRLLFIVAIFAGISLFSQWLPPLDPTGLLRRLDKTWITALGIAAYGVVDLGYFLLFEALWGGQTPGKRQQRLRVIKISGAPIGWLDSAVRNILRAVDMLGGLYPLGLVVIFLSRTNQRLGDYAAGTVVIVERRRRVPEDRTGLRKREGPPLSELESLVSRMDQGQYRILNSFLQRRGDMEETHRRELAGLLCKKLMERWGLQRPHPGISDEAFLEQIVELYEMRKGTL